MTQAASTRPSLLRLWPVTALVMLPIDAVWLTLMAQLEEMGQLLKSSPNLPAAMAFYLLYAAGLLLFAVAPGLEAGSVVKGAALGAALGLVAYGTYDLTNLAILNGFGLRIALIDMAWGSVLSGLSAAAATAIAGRFAG